MYDGYCLSIVSFGFPVWKCLCKHLRGCRKTNLVPCLLRLLNSQTGSASVSTFLPVGKQTLYLSLSCLLNSQSGSASVSTFLHVGKQTLYPCLLCLLISQTGSASVSTFLSVGKQTLYPVCRVF